MLAFSPDGKRLASVGADDAVRPWDVSTGAQLTTQPVRIHVGSSVTSSSRGDVLVSTGDGGSIFLHRASDGSRLAVLRAIEKQDLGYIFTSEHIDFMGSEPCAARVRAACRFGPLSFPIHVCEERAYVKDLLAKSQAGDSSYTEPEYVVEPLSCAAATGTAE